MKRDETQNWICYILAAEGVGLEKGSHRLSLYFHQQRQIVEVSLCFSLLKPVKQCGITIKVR